MKGEGRKVGLSFLDWINSSLMTKRLGDGKNFINKMDLSLLFDTEAFGLIYFEQIDWLTNTLSIATGCNVKYRLAQHRIVPSSLRRLQT